MTRQDLQIGPMPSLWRVLLYRISQSERRERILRDWEEHVFGFRVSGGRPGRGRVRHAARCH
jgi:hypothetical protein